MMSFNDVHPDISLKLFVPDGWSAGRRLQGDRVLSQQPKLVLFGGIGDRDKRVLGELLYFVRSADFDPMVVFAESARQQYQASVVKTTSIGDDGSQKGFLVEYKDPQGRVFLERITIGAKIAVALFIGTAPNQALLDDVNNIIAKSIFVCS